MCVRPSSTPSLHLQPLRAGILAGRALNRGFLVPASGLRMGGQLTNYTRLFPAQVRKTFNEKEKIKSMDK